MKRFLVSTSLVYGDGLPLPRSTAGSGLGVGVGRSFLSAFFFAPDACRAAHWMRNGAPALLQRAGDTGMYRLSSSTKALPWAPHSLYSLPIVHVRLVADSTAACFLCARRQLASTPSPR